MIAFLLESAEIKKHFPPFNKAQKFTTAKYGLYHYEDGRGNQRLSIGKSSKGHRPLMSFTSFDRARNYLITLVKTHQLHPELCSLPATMMQYFGYSFKEGTEEGKDEIEHGNSKDRQDQTLQHEVPQRSSRRPSPHRSPQIILKKQEEKVATRP